MWRAQASVVLSMLMLAACFGGNTNGPKTPSGSPATTATALSTQSAKFFREREVQGDVATGSLWALFYHRRAGEPVKTIWRMTGTGDLSVEATGPGGQTIQPDGSPYRTAAATGPILATNGESSGRSRDQAAGRSTPNVVTARPAPSRSSSPEAPARLATGSCQLGGGITVGQFG